MNLDFCNGDTKGAAEVLNDLCGKTSLTALSQDEAARAIEEFESRYLAAGPRME